MEDRTPRKMVLTPEDIKATVTEMREQGLNHICRYDIAPEDMHHLMAFVRTFYEGAIETRRTFKTMLIRMFEWGTIAGFIGLLSNKLGWVKSLLKFFSSSPP